MISGPDQDRSTDGGWYGFGGSGGFGCGLSLLVVTQAESIGPAAHSVRVVAYLLSSTETHL
jgi:hypothetical protein